MTMTTVDKQTGKATDHGEVWTGEDSERVIVDMEITDDEDAICFSWTEKSGRDVSLYVPVDRVKQLVSE